MKIKICGITTVKDAVTAQDAGADAVGLNFYKHSPRYITTETANEIIRALPGAVDTIGVVVQPDNYDIRELTAATGLETLQLHGRFSFKCSLETLIGVIPAFPVSEEPDLAALTDGTNRMNGQNLPIVGVLVDARVPGLYGGTGRQIPWQLLENWTPPAPLYLAGGLNPENVEEAIRIVRPYAVDVAGGVESSPGVKDPEKIRRFVDTARNAFTKYPTRHPFSK